MIGISVNKFSVFKLETKPNFHFTTSLNRPLNEIVHFCQINVFFVIKNDFHFYDSIIVSVEPMKSEDWLSVFEDRINEQIGEIYYYYYYYEKINYRFFEKLR